MRMANMLSKMATLPIQRRQPQAYAAPSDSPQPKLTRQTPGATSIRQAKMIKNARYVELQVCPRGVLWTHAEQINSELVKFLA